MRNYMYVAVDYQWSPGKILSLALVIFVLYLSAVKPNTQDEVA